MTFRHKRIRGNSNLLFYAYKSGKQIIVEIMYCCCRLQATSIILRRRMIKNIVKNFGSSRNGNIRNWVPVELLCEN